jgi:hypothetical protein
MLEFIFYLKSFFHIFTLHNLDKYLSRLLVLRLMLFFVHFYPIEIVNYIIISVYSLYNIS